MDTGKTQKLWPVLVNRYRACYSKYSSLYCRKEYGDVYIKNMFVCLFSDARAENWVTISSKSTQNNRDEHGTLIFDNGIESINNIFTMSVVCTSDDGRNEILSFTDIGAFPCDGAECSYKKDIRGSDYIFSASLSEWYELSGGSVTVTWRAKVESGNLTSPSQGVLNPTKDPADVCAVDVNTLIDFGQLVGSDVSRAPLTRNKDEYSTIFILPGATNQNEGVLKGFEGDEIPYEVSGGEWSSGLNLYLVSESESSLTVNVPPDITPDSYSDKATVGISCE
ncbi:hypothetical protein ACI2JI_22380 [Enterobacter cancerogenus]|uniref:hypothetical protein n=1 Tax=Enterobacter cancerogenus TaxID=69218 RepID=UPI00384F31C5